MLSIRTDLAVEAHSLWRESAGETGTLSGVETAEQELEGMMLTEVRITSEEGEQALGKPKGTYLTLDISPFWRREAEAFRRTAEAIAQALGGLLPRKGPVLAAGLGNRAMTPDALGPLCMEHLLITRHLGEALPSLRPVAALAAGVLGTTGLEVAEWVRGAAERVKPAAVVLVDALAARDLDRLCNTVQMADTGLVPGSGVGNHRMALNRESLDVPVLSVGVPTVVDAETLARDMLDDGEEPPALRGRGRRLFVTPDSIDAKIRDLAKLIGYGLNMALHPGLRVEDLTALLE